MNLQNKRRGLPQDRVLLYRFSQFMVAAVVFLLLAGAAVKSTESGLSVPDWPLSFGQIMPPMEGGVFFEHGHRMVATAVGFLTMILALWFWVRDPRPALRRLAWIALGLVIVQGILGGVTVLLQLPTLVSAAHACLAQAFLLVVVFLALSLSPSWNQSPAAGASSDSWLPLLSALTTGAVFAQLILGALTRHLNAALVIPDFPLAFGRLVPPAFTPEIAVHYAHRVGAVVVLLLTVVTAGAAFRQRLRGFKLPAAGMLGLVAVQITLGALIVITRRHVHPTTSHVVVGALLLAVCFVLTARSWRFLGSPLGVRTPAREADRGLRGEPA
jgi:cytochrome c oxidase assembly protein subunit 15